MAEEDATNRWRRVEEEWVEGVKARLEAVLVEQGKCLECCVLFVYSGAEWGGQVSPQGCG